MSTIALSLKYRPQSLADLIGQPYIQTTLINALDRMQIAPAYLFTGPRGTGKTSTARIFAKSLNCLSADGPTTAPCGICASCRSIELSNSLDVSEIDAASHNGVDDARELIDRVSLAPVQGRYRVFILDEVHCLSSQAFNALLKCIEEPPQHVVFILCTTEVHKVLPTIASRCQKFEFRALSTKTITRHLRQIADQEEIAIADEALLAIARLVEGGMRDALQLLAQVSLLDGAVTDQQVIELAGGITETELLTMLQAIANQDVFNLLQVARELIDSGKSAKLILSSLLQVYRDLLIVQAAPQEKQLLTSSVHPAQLKKLALQLSNQQVHSAIAQLHQSETQLRQSTNANVWLEVCLLNLMPELNTRSTQTAVPKSPNQNGQQRLTKTDLGQVWQQLIESASPQAQKLLGRATLVSLHQSQAIVQVDPAVLSKFASNSNRIAQMLQKVLKTQRSLSVSFRAAAIVR